MDTKKEKYALITCFNKIKEALNFYEIKDMVYINKCKECLNFINSNDALKQRMQNIFDILYKSRDDELIRLWKVKDVEELFGKKIHPFVTNILLLSGFIIHKEVIRKNNIDESQVAINKKRVKQALTDDIYVRKLEGIRISQMIWGSIFVNFKIIEVGNLQFELTSVNPVNNKKEFCLKIHIPKQERLNIDEAIKSIKRSSIEIRKYFKLEKLKYYCCSWLLSKDIKNILPKASNILRFQKLFEITEGEDCKKDILNFVFGITKDINFEKLEEKTFLQKELKKMLINNRKICLGMGVLKSQFFD